MSEPLAYSLVVGVVVGLSAGYLGSLMVLKKMALVADAMSHVALPGLALGLLFNFNPFFGAFAFLFVSAVLIWQLGRVTNLSFETIVGALFTLSLAIGILIIPEPELLEALFGEITTVSIIDVVASVAVSAIAIFLTHVVYRKIILGLISEDLASSTGINVARTNLLYLLLVSLTVAIGIKIVGTLLVGFLVVVPAATARNLSSSLYKYALLSSVFGSISSFSGVLFSGFLFLPSGPLIVLSGIVLFAISVLLRMILKPSS